MSYTRLLRAKFNPKNNCKVEDGAILTVLPRASVHMKDYIPYFFVSAQDLKTRSKYGWVDEVPAFTAEEFLERFHSGSSDPILAEHVRRMLDAALKVPLDTPMATDYVMRGVSPRRMEFTVHRVIFY